MRRMLRTRFSPIRLPGAPMPGKSSAGFSLVEAMVTVVVASVGLAIGIPSYQSMVKAQRVRAATSLLTSHIASARVTAIAYRAPTVVCPSNGHGACRDDGDWSTGWLMFYDRDGNRQPDEPNDVLRDEQAPRYPGLRLVSSPGRTELRYLASGHASGSNLSVRFCQDGELVASVIVNNAGRARTARPGSTEPCPR